MSNITWADKNNSQDGSHESQFTAADANETKSAVNSKQDYNANTGALAGLSGTGFVKKTGPGTMIVTEDVATLVAGKVPGSQLPAPNFLGVFPSLAALESAYPTAQAGNEAQVDEGTGTDVQKYLWDATDNAWKLGGGTGASTFSDLSGSPYDNPALNTALTTLDTDKQDADADLSAIAALSPGDDDFMQRKSGAWTNRTPAQVKVDLALNNVSNLAPADLPVSTAQAAADAAVLSTAQAYADGLTVGLLDDRGNFDASGGAYPSSGGSGSAGAILKGDLWTISVPGTLPTGQSVEVGDVIRALVNTPGNTQANWAITQNNLGYVPENAANKGGASGYAGLSATFQLILKNVLGTVSSFITTVATVARTYTFPDKNITVAGIDDIPTKADQSTVDTGTNDTQFITPATNRANQEKFRSVTANFSVGSSDRGGTIATNSATDLTATIDQITPGSTLPQVQIIARGTGNINLVGGSGPVTLVGSTFIEAGGGALLSWLSATVVQVVTGSAAQWGQILLKPTTVVGYAMTDAWRVLFQTFTSVGTPNSTTETDLLSRDVGSNLLAFDGERVVVEAAGTFAATPSNSKRLRILLGATLIADTTAVLLGGIQWTARITVMRTASNAQRVWATINYGTATATGYVELTSSDLSSALLLTIKGTGVATSDVTLQMASGDKTGKA